VAIVTERQFLRLFSSKVSSKLSILFIFTEIFLFGQLEANSTFSFQAEKKYKQSFQSEEISEYIQSPSAQPRGHSA
jgi:hypothetical protein